jgi:hypothetical protein
MANDDGRSITEDEKDVVDLLAMAWNKFTALPEQHPCDRPEFMQAVHAAQCIIMARPTQRNMGWRWIEGVGWARDAEEQ